MAESALFSIASKVLSTIASPAFEMAYKRARSIWKATHELKELRETITSIQAVLLDAERQYTDSAAVKNWIGRVRDVLYDADNLFDVVATEDLLKQRMKGKKPLKPVCVFFSKLNPIASRDFISKKVTAIRKDLQRISNDMAQFGFVSCEIEKLSISGIRRGAETGSFVDSVDIIGRDDEKRRVVDFVCGEVYAERNISLISVVGIGGMGKSALAQLVYNDAKIRGAFPRRYWACISDIFDEKEVLGKIYQSMTDQGNYRELSLNLLQSSIRESIDRNGRFLLVLDDLWDEDAGRGSKLWSILSSDCAKGSKIIVTTRHLSVAKAMRADEILELQGLSRDESWALFRRYAFTKDQENDPTWISIGEKIVSKCSNVPLAIKSIACLLRIKDTIGEWRSLENEQLSKIQGSDNPIMSTLRLSYDHLPSHLKNCFAYCSLFPKDYWLEKAKLIHLWIAQGYIMPKEGETLEMAGHACFMELYRRSFFQEAEYDDDYDEMEIRGCKMHDLVHDLAEDVAGEESCIITTQGKNQPHNKIRHLCVYYDDKPANIDNVLPLLDADRLRTYLYPHSRTFSQQLLDEQVTKFRFLHALSLKWQGIDDIPSSIGELKYLRYLDLSHNEFTHLPDSITKLVNLITLDVSFCRKLVKLPGDIGELVSLRHLINFWCGELLMPAALGELTSLEHLSEFWVTTSGVVVDGEFCRLDALGRLNLRGSLRIWFDKRVEWSRDEVLFESGQVPDTLADLSIYYYPSMRMPAWWSGLPKLEHLSITCCDDVKHLPALRSLPCLRSLILFNLPKLEFIEDDEVVSTTPFFPSLCTLKIFRMENLIGWSRPTNTLMFPCLSKLEIEHCRLLSSVPCAPNLKSMHLRYARAELIEELVSRPCASSVEEVVIRDCENLRNFSGEGLTSLRNLEIRDCEALTKVKVAPNTVEEFSIYDCPNIELWEEREDNEMSIDWPSFTNLSVLTLDEEREDNEMSIDWPSFTNLRLLTLDEEEEGRLPDCLQQLIHLGKLRIQMGVRSWNSLQKEDFLCLMNFIKS